MKKYVKPTYEKEVIETADIMSDSGISIDQDFEKSTTDAAADLDSLISKIEQSIRE